MVAHKGSLLGNGRKQCHFPRTELSAVTKQAVPNTACGALHWETMHNLVLLLTSDRVGADTEDLDLSTWSRPKATVGSCYVDHPIESGISNRWELVRR